MRLVKANRIHIEKIAGTLFSNGIEALTEAGLDQGTIDVSVWYERDDQRVHVEVRDYGPGIKPDIRSQIFQPFISTKRRGLGMGLAIARSLIRAQGSDLWVDLNVVNGADFHFTLPVFE